MSVAILLIVHAAATYFMVGLIWFVQIVHYPMFSKVHESVFSRYEAVHQRLTTTVVAPVMVLELASGLWITIRGSSLVGHLISIVAFSFIILIWGVTAAVQVPQHHRLMDGFDEQTWRALVRGNWVRTILWTARGTLVAAMLWGEMQPVFNPGG